MRTSSEEDDVLGDEEADDDDESASDVIEEEAEEEEAEEEEEEVEEDEEDNGGVVELNGGQVRITGDVYGVDEPLAPGTRQRCLNGDALWTLSSARPGNALPELLDSDVRACAASL